jgi:uncharacterized protein (TIGR02145 family)
MAENLNVDRFRNGDPIPEARTKEEWLKADENKQPAWCYYDNNPANGTKYGKLYNWFAVNDSRGLAPAGYHIPTDAEWTTLENYLDSDFTGGKKMKSMSGWNKYTVGTLTYSGNGTNSSGFSGLPGGSRYSDGAFTSIGGYGCWWSSSEDLTYNAWYHALGYDQGYVSRGNFYKGKGLSVRCLRD